MTPGNKKLSDLGMWIGAEAHTYLKLRYFIEAIENSDGELEKQFMREFNNVYSVFKAVIEDK